MYSDGGSNLGGHLLVEFGGGYHHLSPKHGHYSLCNNLLKAVLLFAMITLTVLVLFRAPESPFQLSRSIYSSLAFSSSPVYNSRSCAADSVSRISEELWLKQVLERSAMPNRTVIITTLNEAWIEQDSIFDLFLESFTIGHQTYPLLRHLVVIALDPKAFDRCSVLQLNCYFLGTEGVNFSNEAHFMTPDYLKMMWRRIDFLRNVLELGYNFVFTDADIMWFRNPFLHFYTDDTDFQIARDHFGRSPDDLNNAPNGGFKYVKSNNRTIEFYKLCPASFGSHSPRKKKIGGLTTDAFFFVVQAVRYFDFHYSQMLYDPRTAVVACEQPCKKVMDSDGGSSISIGSQMPQKSGINHQLNPNQKNFSRHRLRTVLMFTTITLACLVLYQASESPFRFLPGSIHSFALSSANNFSNSGKKELGLKHVLKKAAMPDKTVIITTLNEAWIEPDSIFDLFLESFRIGNETSQLLKHLVVVALDQNAFDHCLRTHLNCYFLTTEDINFSDEAHFMTPSYLKMMWRRIDFLRTVLETGYNFVFTVDGICVCAMISYLLDEVTKVRRRHHVVKKSISTFYADTNFQISCDSFGGNPTELNNAPNGGFNYVKSSTQTIEFYKFWYEVREFYPRKHDQDVLNKIKYNPFTRDIGLEIKFLDTAYFGGFCQPSKDLNLVCTMHANCCAGLDNKIHDLKILLEDWRNYLSLPENVRKTQPPSWSVPQSCGPRSFHRHKPRRKNGKTRKEE
ncbi:UNVERIFIED_CONTAM: hypothetical protein Scaly_2372900 [Sesamum calycinum]|uniref:Nucleotide-diphospho-sugar transferase domain-containing protein n=1 Tax=Sesamum calycinum TaxID=2727403 RepID=A0AAW2LZ47_9LAMI